MELAYVRQGEGRPIRRPSSSAAAALSYLSLSLGMYPCALDSPSLCLSLSVLCAPLRSGGGGSPHVKREEERAKNRDSSGAAEQSGGDARSDCVRALRQLREAQLSDLLPYRYRYRRSRCRRSRPLPRRNRGSA